MCKNIRCGFCGHEFEYGEQCVYTFCFSVTDKKGRVITEKLRVVICPKCGEDVEVRDEKSI